jgi:hypothetical protein
MTASCSTRSETFEFRVSALFVGENAGQLCFPEEELCAKKVGLLAVPDRMQIAFAARLGHPVAPGPSGSYAPARREVDEFTHHNRFGSMGLDS